MHRCHPGFQKRRYVAPTKFKLQLIKEVKVHPIIWRNHRNVDQVQLNKAWEIVKTDLNVLQVGYCKSQWALLVHNYRGHLKNRTLDKMNKEIARSLAFLGSEYGHLYYMPFTAGRSPKSRPATQTGQGSSRTGARVDDAEVASLAVVKYLMETESDEKKAYIRDQNIRLLLQYQSGLKEIVMQHGKQQGKAKGSLDNIDWFSVAGQTEVDPNKTIVYKAIWDYEMRQKILRD